MANEFIDSTLPKLIQEKLKKALAEDILFGRLADNGGDVFVTAVDKDIKLEITKRKRQEGKELSKAKS